MCFKDMDQQHLMQGLASEVGEWGQLYPSLSKLAAIGLTIPVSSVNCERDFSTMNRVGYLSKKYNYLTLFKYRPHGPHIHLSVDYYFCSFTGED